jgi:hypothetical protein
VKKKKKKGVCFITKPRYLLPLHIIFQPLSPCPASTRVIEDSELDNREYIILQKHMENVQWTT